MSNSLLSLKWNNHKSTFFHVLSTIRRKDSYSDVTIACDGKFYSLHKFVLSTCSDYFEEMFERTDCKNPVIVLKDIKYDDLEALLNYMYAGEVNVEQEKLGGLIKAAECLRIKGLAVPDEDPLANEKVSQKRSQKSEDSPRAKRRKRNNSSDGEEKRNKTNSTRIRDSLNSQCKNGLEGELSENDQHQSDQDSPKEDSQNSSRNCNKEHSNFSKNNSSQEKEILPEEVTLEDENVKSEPVDLETADVIAEEDNKGSLHHELGFEDSLGAGEGEDFIPESIMEQQSVEDAVNQALPSSSGFQGQNSSFPLWEGDSNFDGFTGDNNSSARQMVRAVGTSEASSSKSESMTSSPRISIVSPASLLSTVRIPLPPLPPLTPSTINSSAPSPTAIKCLHCDFFTDAPETVREHQLLAHPDLKSYMCPHCPYQSKWKGNLRGHIVRMHFQT